MTTDWIKVTDRKPAQSGYYMTVCKGTEKRHNKRYRAMTYFNTGYGFETMEFTVTHWLDYPELPDEVTE